MRNHRDRRSATRSFVAALSAFVVVAAVATVGVLLAKGGSGELASAPGQSLDADLAPGVSLGSEAPIPLPAGVQVQAWTGSEILAFGSSIVADDESMGGVAFNPESGMWRELPAPPFSSTIAITPGGGVWTGEQLVVAGVLCDNRPEEVKRDTDEGTACFPGTAVAAAYSPDDDAWSELKDPPVELEEGNSGFSVWAVGKFGDSAAFRIRDRYLVVDPKTSAWSEIPKPPYGFTCSFGDSLASVGLAGAPSQEELSTAKGPTGLGRAQTWTLSGDASEWMLGAEAPITAQAGETAFNTACGSDGAVIYGIGLDTVWLFTTRDGWQQVSGPVSLPEGTGAQSAFPHVSWTGADYAFWNVAYSSTGDLSPDGTAVLYNPTSGSWQAAAPGPPLDQGLNWVNGVGIVIGTGPDGAGAIAYQP